MVFILYLSVVVYFLAMLSIFFYSLVQANLLFNFLVADKKKNEIQVPAKQRWPKVTVQLPIYNEKYVVERLIQNIASMDYPHDQLEIQILDDSSDETSDIVRNTIKKYPQINFVHLQRSIRTSYKAGALKKGLEAAKGDFIAIFDADFLPASNFLKATVPAFEDAAIGMVQTRWTHLNEDFSMLTKLQAFALNAHFLVEQVGRNAQQAFMNFNGTAGVWRKACIIDAGNWNDDTLTEDLDLSYRAQQRGWRFLYLPHVEAPAELPPVMSALKSQQYRWTKGGAECAKKHLLNILTSGLSLKTRLHAVFHLLNSSIFVLVLLVSLASIPIWWGTLSGLLPLEVMNWAGFSLLGFVVISVVYLVANSYGKKGNSDGRRIKDFGTALLRLPLFLAVSMGLSLHNAVAVCEGFSGKKTPFVRTPKFNLGRSQSLWRDNLYLSFKVPAISYVEGFFAVFFIVMVIVSFLYSHYVLIPFHIALAIGYLLVAYESFTSYSNK